MSIREVKEKVVPILRRHGALKAGLFGSVVRNEARSDSDVDLLVELGDSVGLLEFIGLKQELEETLGRPVDLVEYDTLKPLFRDRVLKEQVPIL